MLRLLKLIFYAAFILVAIFLWWFLPKYSFIHKNPGYCVNLSKHIYYCGENSNIDSFFNLIKK